MVLPANPQQPQERSRVEYNPAVSPPCHPATSAFRGPLAGDPLAVLMALLPAHGAHRARRLLEKGVLRVVKEADSVTLETADGLRLSLSPAQTVAGVQRARWHVTALLDAAEATQRLR